MNLAACKMRMRLKFTPSRKKTRSLKGYSIYLLHINQEKDETKIKSLEMVYQV